MKRTPSARAYVGSTVSYTQDTPQSQRTCTGGIVFSRGQDHYQLVARHLWNLDGYPLAPEPSSRDLDYCHFDDQDDSEEDYDDHEFMSLASCSTTGTLSPDSDTDGKDTSVSQSPCFTHDRCKTSPILHFGYAAYDTVERDPFQALSDTGSQDVMLSEFKVDDLPRAPLGIIHPHHNTPTTQALDYSMTKLFDIPHNPNQFEIEGRLHCAGAASAIPTGETDIFAVTGSMGPCRGTLLPDAVMHMSAAGMTIIYQIHLQCAIATGDSGSTVIDAATGEWYGQVVMGSPGTNQAYIVSALQIMDDINNGSDTELAFSVAEYASVETDQAELAANRNLWNL